MFPFLLFSKVIFHFYHAYDSPGTRFVLPKNSYHKKFNRTIILITFTDK